MFLTTLASGAYAQAVIGLVVSKGGSLPGATVQIAAQNLFTSTGIDGSFTLASTEEGRLRLIITYVGDGVEEFEAGLLFWPFR